MDKKGIKMTNHIINPLLKYVKSMCTKYMQDLKNLMDNEESNSTNYNYLNKMNSLTNIIQKINMNELSININKYIAPFFYLHKLHCAITN